MKKQRAFVAVVVVVAMMTAAGFLLTTTPFSSSSSSSSSSYIPVRSLSLQEVKNIKILTPDTPNEAPGFMDPPPDTPNKPYHFTDPPPVAPLPSNPPPPPDQPPNEEDNLIIPPSKKPIRPPLPPAPPTPTAPADPYEKNENPTLPYLNPVLEQLEGTPGGIWNDVPVNTTDENGKKLKILLFWNEAYGQKHFSLGYGREPFIRAGCRVNTCLATADRERYPLSEVDAIMWHLRSNDKSLPKKRYPHTRYIFWMMESASYPFANMRTYHNVFNWTFTYRRDSDFYNPYQRVFRRRKSLPPPATPINYAKGKTKLAAWFVSNCNTKSGREHMVDELKKLMKVDVYGHCGTLDCPRSNHGHCMALLDADYKFYLSFENSLCTDYVTEKFFGALSVNVVPVVWGFGNYSAIAPRHSFIDALAFPSVRALADYLLYLNTNDTAYNQYFRWKRHYHQTHDWAKKSIAFCDICERLHSNEPPKTYDLQKWFIEDSHCLGYYDTRIQKYIHNKR